MKHFIINNVHAVFEFSNPKMLLSYDQFFLKTVCNFQSMKSPVELGSLLFKFFCYATWLDERRHWRHCKRGLFAKPIVSSKQYLSGFKTTIIHKMFETNFSFGVK